MGSLLFNGCLLKPLCPGVDVLSTQPALLHLSLAGISPSGALNSGLSYSSFRHYPVSKPIIITSCVEHVLLKSALRASTIYHQESCVVSLSVARLLVSIAECKLTSFITHLFKVLRTGLGRLKYWW
ncbi:unnamed protein product [Brassica napus]|uniref:(rape) hypothetical protein n=1 Tax=Brassica napus TaxID=3708 RepID=A0A816V9W0_BRANA|nr:unnamed protein product [Brassica napus]